VKLRGFGQQLIPTGEQSGLRTRIATTESAWNRSVSKAETDTAGNSVGFVITPAKLALVADIGRNSWRPLNAGTSINNSAIMTLVRAENRRRSSRKGRSAEGYW
jgi:hypothetical protein